MKHLINSMLRASVIAALMISSAASCSDDSPENDKPSAEEPRPDLPPEVDGGQGISADDGDKPSLSAELTAWEGRKATDASADKAGSDVDLFHEANTFTNLVTVTFNGATANVSSSNSSIQTHTDGAYVAIDFQSADVSGVEIRVSGTTDDGGLKIYGNSKFMLTLDGAEIESRRGPAVNSQCRKRMFLHIADGTRNVLADAPAYTDDHFYRFGYSAANEDRKGCLFAEGNLIVSGHGTLEVKGRQRHGVATDGYMYMRPGTTLAVTETAKNGVHVKGDLTDGIGFRMDGGLLYVNTSAPAGKCVKTDLDITLNGGVMELNASGDAIYDTADAGTSSGAGLKADRNIELNGGKAEIRTSGNGSKGINANGNLSIASCDLLVSNTGNRFTDSAGNTSAAKGVKADADIMITSGSITVSVTGSTDGCKGIESDKSITVSDGEIIVYSYDDAVSAPAVTISGGTVTAYSGIADGIDADGSLTISGGKVTASGGDTPESGIDCDTADGFKINGGTVISIGGALQTMPSALSRQSVFVVTDVTAAKGSELRLNAPDGNTAFSLAMPRTTEGAVVLVSAPGINGPLTAE